MPHLEERRAVPRWHLTPVPPFKVTQDWKKKNPVASRRKDALRVVASSAGLTPRTASFLGPESQRCAVLILMPTWPTGPPVHSSSLAHSRYREIRPHEGAGTTDRPGPSTGKGTARLSGFRAQDSSCVHIYRGHQRQGSHLSNSRAGTLWQNIPTQGSASGRRSHISKVMGLPSKGNHPQNEKATYPRGDNQYLQIICLNRN